MTAINDSRLQAALNRVSRRRSATKAQVALAWLIHKGALPIPGTRRPERVAEYAGAAGIELTSDDIKELDDASSKYVWVWGKDYNVFWYARYIPEPLQRFAVLVERGV